MRRSIIVQLLRLYKTITLSLEYVVLLSLTVVCLRVRFRQIFDGPAQHVPIVRRLIRDLSVGRHAGIRSDPRRVLDIRSLCRIVVHRGKAALMQVRPRRRHILVAGSYDRRHATIELLG